MVFIVYCCEGLKIRVKIKSTCQESLPAAQKFNYKLKCIWCILNALKENRLGERDNGPSFQSKGKIITLFRARLLYAYCAGEVRKILGPQRKACCILIRWCAISVHKWNCQRHFTQGPRTQRGLLFGFWSGLTAKLKCSILFLTFSFWGGTLSDRAVNPIPPLNGCQLAAVLQSVT